MSLAGFSFETAMRRTCGECSALVQGIIEQEAGEFREEEKRGGQRREREAEAYYILSAGCVCGFYLREDVAEVFGQLLCAGGVDWHFFLS